MMVRYGKKAASRLARTLDLRHGMACGRESGGSASAGQWAYSAELLVFWALEREISRDAIEGARVADVLEVLNGLSIYPEAIGSCARKVEAKYWPLLFPRGDEPKTLLQHCLTSSPPRPQLASIFLVIIQATTGPAAAVEAAAPILAVALHFGACSLSYGLAAQILGFIHRSEEASLRERQEQQKRHRDTDFAAWFALTSLYASSDAAGEQEEQRRQRTADVPLDASSKEVLRRHVASLVASCNLRALSALLFALGSSPPHPPSPSPLAAFAHPLVCWSPPARSATPARRVGASAGCMQWQAGRFLCRTSRPTRLRCRSWSRRQRDICQHLQRNPRVSTRLAL